MHQLAKSHNRTTLPISLLIAVVALLALFLPQFAIAHGMSEADKLAILDGGNLRYMWLGATHMLTGYDHLAFVFGILFFLTNFRDIAKYVTAFTLGHSVTLIIATFNAIQLNYFLIDAVIGLSVTYIAFANIDGFRKYLRINPPNILVMITGLGLIHGFGLSTRLQELPLSEDDLLLNIISFNVGIEFGQIGALVLMILILRAWRNSDSFMTFSIISNYGLMLAGGLLFLMQMHGYTHTANPEEFITAAVTSPVTSANVASSGGNSTDLGQQSTQAEWRDTIKITIAARSDKEYKFFLQRAATLDYVWKTAGEKLFFEFHGEPQGDTSGFFQSYNKNTRSESSGSLTAPFTGVHGWYWKNNSPQAVTVVLQAKGNYQRLDTGEPLPQVQDTTEQRPATTHDSID